MTPDALRGLVESYLDELALTPELGDVAEGMRYALTGGKRIRGVLCLAVAEAAGADAEAALPAAAALELVQAFSLVHDDLPALDDDALRRGQPSTHVRFGEGVAVLVGDALLAEAFRLALSYGRVEVARELAQATLAMIGGQYLDITGGAHDPTALHALKTGALFRAAVTCGVLVGGVPEHAHRPWREFADEVGLLFQLVDDILDEDGFVLSHGVEGTRGLADEAAARAHERLAHVEGDASVLREIVSSLAARTS